MYVKPNTERILKLYSILHQNKQSYCKQSNGNFALFLKKILKPKFLLCYMIMICM